MVLAVVMNRPAMNRRYRVAAALVAAVVLLVPPLVRANAHLRRPNDSPITFRLNRGFDVPLTKSTIAPPAERSSEDVAGAHAVLSRLPKRVPIDDQPPCLDQHRQSPDPLRGPPATPAL